MRAESVDVYKRQVLSLVIFISLTGLIGVVSMEQMVNQKNVKTVVKELNLKELAGSKMGEAQKLSLIHI